MEGMIIRMETKLLDTLKQNIPKYKDGYQTVKRTSHWEFMQLYIEKNASAYSFFNV